VKRSGQWGEPAIAAYRLEQKRRGLSAETLRVRRIVLRDFAAWLRGSDILTATRADVNAWLDAKSLTARSRSKYLSHLHCFYDFAIAEGMSDSDPTAQITRPKNRRLLPRPVGDNDLAFVLKTAPTKERAMLSLAAFAGLRCMEIAALRTEDVLVDRSPPMLVVADGKGGRQRYSRLPRRLSGHSSAMAFPTRDRSS
jgi:site-specific recombinase XerD